MSQKRNTQLLSSLTVFFPMFNEEKNVGPMIESAIEILPRITKKYEVIVVDDGSTDDTRKIAQKYQRKNQNVKIITHKMNLGYGASLRTGFAAARYDWVFFTDGDQQFDMQELFSFVTFSKKYDVIIGYRKNRAEGWMRHFNASLFKLFIDLLFRLHVKDIDCAFKLIKSDVIRAIHLESDGAMINAEFLYKLKKNHISVKQLPVSHYLRQHGDPSGANFNVIVKAMVEFARMYIKIKSEMLVLRWKKL